MAGHSCADYARGLVAITSEVFQVKANRALSWSIGWDPASAVKLSESQAQFSIPAARARAGWVHNNKCSFLLDVTLRDPPMISIRAFSGHKFKIICQCATVYLEFVWFFENLKIA